MSEITSLPVCRFGGAPPHGMARDCCVLLLLQRVSLSHLPRYPWPSGLHQGLPCQHLQMVLSPDEFGVFRQQLTIRNMNYGSIYLPE